MSSIPASMTSRIKADTRNKFCFNHVGFGLKIKTVPYLLETWSQNHIPHLLIPDLFLSRFLVWLVAHFVIRPQWVGSKSSFCPSYWEHFGSSAPPVVSSDIVTLSKNPLVYPPVACRLFLMCPGHEMCLHDHPWSILWLGRLRPLLSSYSGTSSILASGLRIQELPYLARYPCIGSHTFSVALAYHGHFAAFAVSLLARTVRSALDRAIQIAVIFSLPPFSCGLFPRQT
ncbi:hypothetical protein BS47DRAFT_1481579 [Hydnum rufescens UP504]|uniref:Uncharacterized protein n=1 Tax=Hydnum rufescens UP504 TaxID=1448309 RepID=A0A9P6B9W9_9AGAM|nr:hypothetical protein BS47DRAFT_1481579 [Hydnum rufescens UP504]